MPSCVAAVPPEWHLPPRSAIIDEPMPSSSSPIPSPDRRPDGEHTDRPDVDAEIDPFSREYALREAERRGLRIPRADETEAYAVDADAFARPALAGEVAVAPDLDRLIDLLAADLVIHSVTCARTFGDFHIALSGGRTPVKLYERLMYDPNCRQIPWRKTHLWIVEERAVPWEDPRSTFGTIKGTIVDHSDIPPEQVHPISVNARDAAAGYEQLLRESLGWREKGQDRLDFVLLGLGADGSTAGFAPGSPALAERQRLVADVTSESIPRITMTLPLLNAARFVAVLAAGTGKADAVQRLAGGTAPLQVPPAHDLPARAIQPIGGQLKWYLDTAACERALGDA